MSVALTGLILLQFYWISNVYQLHSERFKKEIKAAVDNAIRDVENYEQDAVYNKLLQNHLKAKSKNTFDITPIVSKGQYVAIKDTSLDSHKDKDYLVVSGVAFDSVTGITAEHRLITQNFGKQFERDIEYTGFNSKDSSLRYHDKVSHLFEKGVLEKSRYLNELMIKMFTSNLFDDIKLRLSAQTLDSLLTYRLLKQEIDTVFNFRVVNDKKEVVAFNHSPSRYNPQLVDAEFKFRLFPNDIVSSKYFLELDFPQKKSFLFKQMLGTLAAALLLILLVVFAFYFAVSTIFKQKKLSEIKNDFISNMTHELKTPISTIALACEAIEDPDVKKNPNTLVTFIDMISSENKRLGLLVEKVLQTSLLEKGKLSLKKSIYQIDELVKDAVNSFRIQFQQKGGNLRIIQLDQIEWEVDKIHFSNVLYNLMDNALKYSKEKPVCKVELIKEDDGFSFLITDDGIGIKKEDQKLIFDKLYRVSTGDVHDVKGFGLGLDYVKRIVEMHDAEISVKSEFGVGTTFKIKFKK